MKKIAIFVDAGYFWVAVSKILYGEKRDRSGIFIDFCKMREKFILLLEKEFPGYEILRFYWFDGPSIENGGLSSAHMEIANLDNFNLCLGFLNTAEGSANGKEVKQKAVDGSIITKMITLAQNKAISDILLVSGDGDLLPGIILVQDAGIRVHCLKIASKTETISKLVRRAVDSTRIWEEKDVFDFQKDSPVLSPDQCFSGVVIETFADAIGKTFDVIKERKWEDRLALIHDSSELPREVDKILLIEARCEKGADLEEEERRALRKAFMNFIKNRM
jgi:uncharacterized LabA/DUF88 family protein